ncbi:MAG TPA: hypothetical protein VIM53_01840 [Candidatus Saccharimonadales bacterium]
MTGANHIATGALIGATFSAPVVVPLAFVSHFAMDALPHFGNKGFSRRSKRFIAVVTIDALIVVAITATIIVLKPHHWQLMLAGGVLAMMPDAVHAPNFLRELRGREMHRHESRLSRLHGRVQREYAWGIIVEVVWLALIAPFLLRAL